MPDQSKRPWRGGTPKGGASADTKKPWRPKEAAPAAPTKSTKKFRIVAALLGILVAVGLLVSVLLMLNRPKLAYLELSGAAYTPVDGANQEDNLGVPPNPYSQQNLNDLKKYATHERPVTLWHSERLFQPNTESYTYQSKSRTNFLKDLKKVQQETVIVYLALHGGADNKGPYLIPNDYPIYPLNEKTQGADLLRVREVLEALAELTDKKKVLILDATQLQAHAPLGMLHNDFVRQLENLFQEFKTKKNLVVLCASSQGQRSWTSEEWGRTVFGHYLIEGLRGAAGSPTDSDRRINMEELYDYVKKNVSTWARANRSEEQVPLLLKSEDTNLSKIELVAIKEAYQKESPRPEGAALATLAVRDQLKTAWIDCYALSKQIPAPATHSPQLWRRYLDTLLRYEYLVRSGYPANNGADRLLADLQKCKKQMEDARRLPGSLEKVVPEALPMYAALGQSVRWSDDQLRKWLNDLLTPDPKTKKGRKEIWEEIAKGPDKEPVVKDPADDLLLRIKLASLVLQGTDQSLEAEEREKRNNLLQFLFPDSQRRPAEVHYLMMLHQDLNKSEQPKAALLSKALEVRLLAEQVALGVKDSPGGNYDTARVYPWIEDLITRADQKRYLGQDFLFGADPGDWEKAKTKLEEAEKLYQEAHRVFGVVRDTLAVRDEALAKLPFYSQWLAQGRLPRGPQDPKEELEKWVKKTEKLWQQTHLLAGHLKQPTAGGLRPSASLADEAAPVRKGLDELAHYFDKACTQLKEEAAKAKLQSLWHEIDAALTVPFIQPTLRLELLAASQEMSTKFLQEFESNPDLKLAPQEDDAAAKARTTERWKAAARLQGRLAIAELGRLWIDRQFDNKKAGLNFDALDKMLQHDQDQWWMPLNQVGEQVGKLWRRLPQQIDEIANQAAKTDSLAGMEADLANAELACRQLDGAATGASKFDPVLENRLVRLHRLLLDRAERAWQEHWACTEVEQQPHKKPYYMTAVQVYLDAARNLTDARSYKAVASLRHKEIGTRATNWKETKVTWKPFTQPIDCTSERDFLLQFEIQAEGVPDGVAMFRLETGKPLVPAAADKKRRSYDLIQGAVSKPLLYTLANPALKLVGTAPPKEMLAKVKATLHGRYRGQRIEPAADINLHLVPETIVYHRPPPNAAGIRVRADKDLHSGAVAIVLDCSGSMKPDPKKRGRYDDARDVLERVLQQLRPGTDLSVWVFGHYVEGSQKRANVAQLREMAPWDARTQLKKLMAKLNLTPWGFTPLVETMVDAAKKDLEGRPGFKTLLVLTDGDDSEYKKELPKEARVKAIKAKLFKEFKAPQDQDQSNQIMINMIIFNDDTPQGKSDIQEAEYQFRDVIETLNATGSKLRSGWYVEKNAKNLGNILQEAMRPQVRLIQDEVVLKKLPMSFKNDPALDWWTFGNLKKNILYTVALHNTFQDVRLDRGDWMTLLARSHPDKGGQITFERQLFADLPGSKIKAVKKREDWQLAVLQNQHWPQRNTLEMLVTLENWSGVNPKEGLLRQIRPGFTWFEVTNKGTANRGGLRWGNEWQYPGPAWKLKVDNWPVEGPDPQRPLLAAWWIVDKLPIDRLVKHQKSKRFEDEFKDYTTLKVGDVSVVIESVTVEKHTLEGYSEEADCLVVRLRHEGGKPIWVQLGGLEPVGEERHFYAKAGKVTAIFRGISRALAQESEFALKLTSLDALKNDNNTTFHIGGNDLLLRTPDGAGGPDPVGLNR